MPPARPPPSISSSSSSSTSSYDRISATDVRDAHALSHPPYLTPRELTRLHCAYEPHVADAYIALHERSVAASGAHADAIRTVLRAGELAREVAGLEGEVRLLDGAVERLGAAEDGIEVLGAEVEALRVQVDGLREEARREAERWVNLGECEERNRELERAKGRGKRVRRGN
jgi:hypothetical protein